jgi:hypothetical protein
VQEFEKCSNFGKTGRNLPGGRDNKKYIIFSLYHNLEEIIGLSIFAHEIVF